jgi:hypothetical protein
MQTTSMRPDKLHAATKPIVRLTQPCNTQLHDSFRACTALVPGPCCTDWAPDTFWGTAATLSELTAHRRGTHPVKTWHYELEDGWCAADAGAQRGQSEANTSHPLAARGAERAASPQPALLRRGRRDSGGLDRRRPLSGRRMRPFAIRADNLHCWLWLCIAKSDPRAAPRLAAPAQCKDARGRSQAPSASAPHAPLRSRRRCARLRPTQMKTNNTHCGHRPASSRPRWPRPTSAHSHKFHSSDASAGAAAAIRSLPAQAPARASASHTPLPRTARAATPA